MDKVRLIVSVIWRERFWVLTVLGLIIAVSCWYLSASDLDKEFASRKTAISGTLSSMRNLSQEVDHPNSNVIEGDKEQARAQRDNTLQQWQALYAIQKDEVLKWPADNLKPEFIEAIENLKFRDPFPANLRENMRAHYWNYIGKRFDGLLEIVQALKVEGARGRSGGGGRFGGEFEGGAMMRAGMNGEEIEEDYLVQWLDQGTLRDKLDFTSKPTTLQIWVTQEDLWVYQTLLHVIANTNEASGASRPDNAVIRTIYTLEVGRQAAIASRQQSEILMPNAGGEGGGPGMRGGGESFREGGASEYMGGGRGEMMGEGRGFGDGGSEITDEMVLAGRYLNAAGEPSESGPEDPEFRRLPIFMNLEMDQRWLPHLLVECANAALPVEVEQVKINPEKSGGSFATSGGRFGGGGRRGGEFGRMTTGDEDTMPNPNIAKVEIQGVVYIYNEPDSSVLSLPGLDEPGLDNQQAANPTNLR